MVLKIRSWSILLKNSVFKSKIMAAASYLARGKLLDMPSSVQMMGFSG
jgi:hypothetical protein